MADRELMARDTRESPTLIPDGNPNPVLRVDGTGTVVYANPSSGPILSALGIDVGDRVPEETLARVRACRAQQPPGRFEIGAEEGRRTFAVTCVDVPALGVMDLYGQDITAWKVVERFPDRNPNPVLRIDRDGVLIYANGASEPIVRSLDLRIGSPIPAPLHNEIHDARAGDGAVEVRGEGRIYALRPVDIAEFGYTHLYGTDVTATRAVDRFPNLNPNPVLRITREGRLQYANPASEPIRAALGIEIGDLLPDELLGRIRAAVESDKPAVVEVIAGDRIFEVLVASVFEFESINLYGTDVTAARLVESANAEKERLLLNILPASIAERLLGGENPIADRFDAMTVLFADVADFTPFSARRPPTEILEILNTIFSAFDDLAERHGLEKIKTVGDAYMVAGGLSPGGEDDAERMADIGLEMVAAVERIGREIGEPLAIRVGLHAGPAVAGVIGIRKFIYDVWGDTVNTASRMESHGVVGRVQVTDSTYRRLRETHDFERRGVIDVKGKGPTETWLLIGRRNGSSGSTGS